MARNIYSPDSGIIVSDHQYDFSGGENSVTDKALLEPNQSASLINFFVKRGGGITARGGYKLAQSSAVLNAPGKWVGEFEQPSVQMLGFEQIPNAWYDETMQPRLTIMAQTPRTGDAFYWGSRQKFFSITPYFILAYAPGSATQGIVWELSKGGGLWKDITGTMVGNADHIKLAAAAVPVEAPLSWPDDVLWLPDQVETRTYQYWIRARVTVDLQNGGSSVVHGQRRMLSDSVGQRKLFVVGGVAGYELPGMTLTRQANNIFSGQGNPRMGGAAFGEYLYYHTGGLKPLKRWNGCRGTTRGLYNNSPVTAGLSAPAALTQTNAAVASGYANNAVIRARLSKLHGPSGILGESPPSASVEVTLGGAGPYRIRWDFTTAKTAAAQDDVWGFRIYVTTNLVNVTNVNERDRIERFLFIKEIQRDDADWNNGYYDDANVARVEVNPVVLSGPPFYPKGVTAGGERLWIWNDHFVACSDTRRGELWDPVLQFKFQNVVTCYWWEGVLYVFQPDKISAIRNISTTLPSVEVVVDGLGSVQPESVQACAGSLFFMSKLGPARFPTGAWLQSRDVRDLLIGLGKVFESPTWWNGAAGERRFAQAAYFNNRYWIPIDSGASKTSTDQAVAVFGLYSGGWSFLQYVDSGAVNMPIGSMAVVHGTLEHPLADKLCLVAFPDTSSVDSGKLVILEYGTSDHWTTNPYDGAAINHTWKSRGLSMGALHRTKAFKRGHIRVKYPKAVTARTLAVSLLPDIGAGASQAPTIAESTASPYYVDFRWDPSALGASGGVYEENCPQLSISGASDNGLDILAWWLEAELQEAETGWQV